MKRRALKAVTVAVIASPAMAAPVAAADPAVPQVDAPCPQAVAGALAQLPDLKTVVGCQDPGDGQLRWRTYDSPYPKSDRWFSYGPALTLHGEGQRNREIDSGRWFGYPQTPDTRCGAAQLDNAAAGNRTAPQVSTGQPGQPLDVQVVPMLFTVELTGQCLWQKEQ
ncbi:hypothetical protein [Mycobacterium sp. 1274761.0]|uniref:hypothetical protein n=1 Tax=Mycobacterium sp. 1274761.0 TaxID=1834077 RepID=UPI0008010522|nr:hypothetical protein [Mycobacterium sp. 1274761.0]OBK71976.1 hypothetical protein A5651_17515 [Mycobacterium sp. 1274761.0]